MPPFIVRFYFRVTQRLYDKGLLQTVDGLRICDIESKNKAQRERFLTRILEALALVKSHDPRRYRRLQRHLDYVVNNAGFGAGSYNHILRSCEIDFARYPYGEDEDWSRLMLACTLVHEATHGEVLSRGIPDKREFYLRMERLCHQEEVRFAHRVSHEVDLGDFDETWWREYYESSNWQRTVRLIRHFREGEQPTI